MFAYIIRRLLMLPIVFFGVTLFIVLLMQVLSPYQRAAAYAQTENQARNLDAIIERYGLDDPWYQQYGRWLGEVSKGNLGYSRTSSEPVLTTIQKRFPPTVELALLSFFPIIGIGVWLGTLAALNRDKFIDQIARIMAIAGWSLPTFVLGIWLLVIFYGALGLFEPGPLSTNYAIEIATSDFRRVTGMLTIDALINGRFDIFWNALKHLVLPVVTLTVVSSAQIMRVMRSSLLDAMSQDYVRTAKAKGLATNIVNRKHARQNALIPIITLSGFVLIGLINGVIVTETIFNLPGLGQWSAQAAVNLDYAAVLGFAIFTSLLVVIGNLLVDIVYGIVDPRIRYT